MHFMNPFSGEVSTVESLVKEKYFQRNRNQIDPIDWKEIDPDGVEEFLYANIESGELNTVSECIGAFEFSEDYVHAKGKNLDGDDDTEPYIEVVLDQEGYWTNVDGSDLESPT